jgi:hypothetical protein
MDGSVPRQGLTDRGSVAGSWAALVWGWRQGEKRLSVSVWDGLLAVVSACCGLLIPLPMAVTPDRSSCVQVR